MVLALVISDRAGDLEQKLRQDLEELLAQAEKTDSEGALGSRQEGTTRGWGGADGRGIRAAAE